MREGGGGEDEQSAGLLAKICESAVHPIAGADPAPVEERGLGGGGVRGLDTHNMSAAG